MPLRVAFVGKGGAGKSTISGTFARLLARRGEPVLAIDSDPMPGLNYTLGLPVIDVAIPDDAVVEGPSGQNPRFRLRADLDATAAVEAYAPIGADGVRYLQFGNHRGQVSTQLRAQAAFRQIVNELPRDRWNLVGDLPGGTRQPMFGWGQFADTIVIVVEPTPKSISTANRLVHLREATWAPERLVAVVNRARSPDDTATVAERTGLEILASIPDDDSVAAADRVGLAPLDSGKHSPFVLAVQELVDQLTSVSGSNTATLKGVLA